MYYYYMFLNIILRRLFMGLNSQTFRSRGCSWTCLVRFCALIHRFYFFFPVRWTCPSCCYPSVPLCLLYSWGLAELTRGSSRFSTQRRQYLLCGRSPLFHLPLRARRAVDDQQPLARSGRPDYEHGSSRFIGMAGKCHATRPEFLIRHWSCLERSFAVHRANFGKCFICTVHANLLCNSITFFPLLFLCIFRPLRPLRYPSGRYGWLRQFLQLKPLASLLPRVFLSGVPMGIRRQFVTWSQIAPYRLFSNIWTFPSLNTCFRQPTILYR